MFFAAADVRLRLGWKAVIDKEGLTRHVWANNNRRKHLMPRNHHQAWFRVKKHGYGVGLPISWQGWLLLIGYICAIAIAAVLHSEVASLVVLLVLTPIVLVVAYLRSDDDWRWRNGD